MKEITRIHIAKVTYEAELEAKKELEAYLKSLEAYSDDADILDDIEVRMTEILSERGVKKGGVVTVKDVKALRKQLGEPNEFMGDGDIAVGPEDESQLHPESSRKLFRDIDHAVVGGVLSGIAAFFKVSPALIRILFIIIAFASFGTALLVYIVLWIAVPPAKTAADKLQMNGQPVTLSSIRKLNESEARTLRTADKQSKRVLLTLLGVFSVMGAVGAIFMTLFVTGVVIFGQSNHYIQMGDGSGFFIAAFVLAVASGLLLTILFSLGAYASFAMRATKRVIVSMVVIVVVGLLSFGTALGLAQYGSLRYGNAIKANMHEEQLPLPAGSETMDSLIVDAPNAQILYIVSNDTPRVVARTVPGKSDSIKDITVSFEGKTLKVTGGQRQHPDCKVFWCEGPFITVYGPALKQLTAEKKTDVDYASETQDRLEITTKEGAEVIISRGTIKTLAFTAMSGSAVEAGAATITSVEATINSDTNVELGTIANFTLTGPTSCPASSAAGMEVAGVTATTMVLNGQQVPVKSFENGCMKISIESSEE
jgi:phage shock protein PspC (stress-responsive transcriptional regulator)